MPFQLSKSSVLLCTDMDRTILPNGLQVESPQARPMLRSMAARPEFSLAYVSGRRAQLQQNAIAEYDLPMPAWCVGDVGTSVYRIHDNKWELSQAWIARIAPSWRGKRSEDLAKHLEELTELTLQEPEAQAPFKLSYFARPSDYGTGLLDAIRRCLDPLKLGYSLIWSVDETEDQGLLDVLPQNATKLDAVRFLIEQTGIPRNRMVYAGDSGNDLPVLVSELQGVLVRNATDEVCHEALTETKTNHTTSQLYLATGDFMGMNGNYSAGILEGLAHFIPETKEWMI